MALQRVTPPSTLLIRFPFPWQQPGPPTAGGQSAQGEVIKHPSGIEHFPPRIQSPAELNHRRKSPGLGPFLGYLSQQKFPELFMQLRIHGGLLAKKGAGKTGPIKKLMLNLECAVHRRDIQPPEQAGVDIRRKAVIHRANELREIPILNPLRRAVFSHRADHITADSQPFHWAGPVKIGLTPSMISAAASSGISGIRPRPFQFQ